MIQCACGRFFRGNRRFDDEELYDEHIIKVLIRNGLKHHIILQKDRDFIFRSCR